MAVLVFSTLIEGFKKPFRPPFASGGRSTSTLVPIEKGVVAKLVSGAIADAIVLA